MGFRIVIAGESQCLMFAESCLVADFLTQNLPDFCYDRVEIPVLDWPAWLFNINQKNKWHHEGSPIIWKEMLMAGSKPYYIGCASSFLDYCFSYYNFDSLFACNKYEDIVKNIAQYKKKLEVEKRLHHKEDSKTPTTEDTKRHFIVTLSGVSNALAMHIISGLLEMNFDGRAVTKIFVYDDSCSEDFMLSLERECSYIEGYLPGKIVKYVSRIGIALTSTDLLIILDHVPLTQDMAIGEWLQANRKIMDKLALMINASGARKMYILFPNLGPACYNATRLMEKVTITKGHIVVATSDLGLEIMPVAAEIANVHSRNMFCPPVWGFVGINHLVDIRTTVQRYDSFDPYKRFTKVVKSSLKIGALIPEFRTMDYLMFFDEKLWKNVAETKKRYPKGQPWLNKSIALLNLVRQWLFNPNPNDIVNLGIHCNGSFGINFDGVFSQPARLLNDEWTSATDFLLPKDRQMSIKYLEEMAIWIMKHHSDKNLLPPIVPCNPCTCQEKFYKKPFCCRHYNKRY